jgi:hypothetical protein
MSLRPILASFACAVGLSACATAGAALPGAQSVPATNVPYVLGTRPFLGANAGSGVTGRALCPVAKPGFGRCHAIRRTDALKVSARDVRAFVPFYEKACFQGNAVCYSPQDLWQAYNLPSTSMGAGQVVAVVDAHNDPSAESDLAMYRAKFGLSPCGSNGGCFRKVGQAGSSLHLPSGSAWRDEESLDLEMVSAVCPNCRLLLVEASSNSLANLAAAENEAVKHGATVISNSWSAPEWAAGDPAYDHPGVAITASAGDNGYGSCLPDYGCEGPQGPAGFASVISVGGTRLIPNVSGRGFAERVWNCHQDVPASCGLSSLSATGSGCSGMVPKPKWQTDPGCTMRSYSDVSAVADVVTGVMAVDDGEWTIWGGTSVASPIVAAAIALAGNAKSLHGASAIWRSQGAHFFDVTVGNDVVVRTDGRGHDPGACPPVYAYICEARRGYDGPTGWGTPNGVAGL